VKSTEAFSRALKPRKPGDAVELTVRRGDKEETLKITLGFGPM
jgi:S1-C subfamily serine protease